MTTRIPWLVLPVAAAVGLLFAFEQRRPLRRRTRPLLTRLAANAALSGLTFLVAAVVVRPAALRALHWTGVRPFGLVHVMPLPAGAAVPVAFLLLDLSFYWWHVANHRVPLLWRFHAVHHVDPDLDVTTAFRFHAGEVALSSLFRVVQVLLIGPPAAAFAAYELAFQLNTLFHHSNVRLPIAAERRLNRLLVTPRMHGIHHSQLRRETDSNYSVVFSWWDRLHRTIGLDVPQQAVVIGVPGYRPEDAAFGRSLVQPFRPPRDAWDDRRLARQLGRPARPADRGPLAD